MIQKALPVPRVILYEGPRAEPLGLELRSGLVQKLLERGIAVRRVSRAEVSLDSSTAAEEPLILGRFGGRLPASSHDDRELPVRLRDITGLTIEDVLALVDTLCGALTTKVNGKRWKPWFPVIDFNRCTNCMQCLSFCLFDVYGVTTGGKIQVQNESNCKTDCPACSREKLRGGTRCLRSMCYCPACRGRRAPYISNVFVCGTVTRSWPCWHCQRRMR